MLEVRDVTKIYNAGKITEHRLFEHFSLTVEQGQFVAIVGSNGSGKSALARALSGELTLLSGQRENTFARVTRLSFEQLQKLHLCGVKLHPDFQNFPIDDPRAYPMYDMIQSSGLPILMHMGDARSDFSQP